MAEKKSLVEETLLQMKSLENVISENAKGILHSTMKEEIGELVKESLGGQDEMGTDEMFEDDSDDMEVPDSDDVSDDMMDTEDDEMDDMSDEEDDTDLDDEEESDLTSDDEEEEEPVVDLTGASDDEILKVFKSMDEKDGIIVKKDGNTISIDDTNSDVHYKISLGESMDDSDMMMSDDFSDDDTDFSEFTDDEGDSGFEEIGDLDDEDEEIGALDMYSDEEESPEEDEINFEDEVVYEIAMDEDSDEDDDVFSDESGENIYEIAMDDDDDDDEDDDDDKDDEEFYESWEKDESIEEGFKPKGTGMGKAAKFKYKKTSGGFKETMKQGTKGVGMGKPKFEFKKGENMGGKNKIVKKSETKEASRTLGAGRRFGRKGLPKPKAAPRHLNVESVQREVTLLREKNEEYRKALNVFRNKLNEVAVFNSNLAYATRLFTEHSTTKQEKINILRRFDSVESLKESKSLYRTIKDELSSQGSSKMVKESIQEKIERTPSSGSAANLIESKTYENPQFLRMKDLMSKMNIIK